MKRRRKKTKKFVNKKEVIVGILVFVYVIVICCIGTKLLGERADAKAEYERKEQKYNSLQRAKNETEMKEMIEEIENEKLILSGRIEGIENNNKFTEIFNEFKSGAPISWSEEKISLREGTKEVADYDVYSVTIDPFTGSFEQVEQFLEYVENYDKIVRIDTLSIRKNSITGKMGGQVKLSFYFKKMSV